MNGFKESGIEWIGNIPENWNLNKLKNIQSYQYINGFGFDSNDFVSNGNIPVIRIGDFTNNILNLTEACKTLEKKNLVNYCVKKDDILIAMSGATVGKIAYVSSLDNNKLMYINQRVGIIRLPINVSKYVYYTLFTKGFLDYINLLSIGTAQPNISTSNIKNFIIPTAKESIKISMFLDKKVKLIDNTISKTKESIKQYKQYRQSLIAELVTKGLNPNVEMKESGIEWVGEIPRHWKISSVKQHYNVVLGKMLQSEKHGDNDFLKDYLCAKDISWDEIDTQNLKKMWISLKERESLRIKTGDLIVTEGGNVGVAAIVKNSIKECYIQNALHKVESKGNSDNTFLYYWLYFVKKIGYVDLICNKATFAHFTKSKFENLTLVYPPSKEQNQLVIYLNDKSEKIDTIINNKELLIKQLESYKKSLIYEVVTGKKELN